MKAWLAGVQHIPWKQQLDLHEVEAMSDPDAFDDLLEAVEGGLDGAAGATTVRRVNTPLPTFQRHSDASRKTAASTNWDSEFASAQAHARDLISKLGNG